MNNQPIYKTAAELGIEQWEHDGLAALVGPLSRGELNYDQGSYYVTREKVECGTAVCIGGWLAYYHKIEPHQYVDSHDISDPNTGARSGLSELFWGYISGDASHHQGSRAIVNFLVTGDPQWDAVMAEAA